MTYSLIIVRGNSDPTHVTDLKSWPQVTYYLRHKLDQWTTKVHIYKWSNNNRCLGSKCVTMGNLWEVANSANDKVLI